MSFNSPLLQGAFEDAYEEGLGAKDGDVASYIPALANVDPDQFGMAIASMDGDLYSAGDADVEFTIQSVSKPFSLVLALEYGPEAVFQRLDVEASGRAFNSTTLHPRGVPFNPMVNAGALAVAGILYDQWGDSAKDELVDGFSILAGEDLSVDADVYESEMESGDTNRQIAWLLKGEGVLSTVEPVIELYFTACSIKVSAERLAVMAATLANVGKNPITGEVVADQTAVRHTLSIVSTSGMYDESGRFALEIGVPAKSGVSGDLIAIVNNQLGLGFWAPPLDERGNSIKSMAACRSLSAELDLHAFAASNQGSGVLAAFLS
jgi:glutaminase